MEHVSALMNQELEVYYMKYHQMFYEDQFHNVLKSYLYMFFFFSMIIESRKITDFFEYKFYNKT